MLRGLALGCRHLREQLSLETFSTEGLAAGPTARVANDFLILVIDGDRRGIRLNGEPVSDKTRRHAIAVAIKRQSEIFVNEGFSRVSIILRDGWYGKQTIATKTFIRDRTGFAMTSPVGNGLQPVMRLRVDVSEVGESA